MKTVLIKLLLVMLIALTIASCSKEEVEVVNSSTVPQSKERITPQQKNEVRSRFARALAKASSNSMFTSYLNAEAMRELDGDRDILYANIKNNVVPGTKKEVYEFLAETELEDIKTRDSSIIDPVAFFADGITSVDPGLVVYLYIPEAMDSLANVKKVALVDEGFDEHSATEVPIFDELGNATSIPASIAYPDEPYYVVKESEVLLPIVEATGLTVTGVQIDVSGLLYEYNIDGIAYYHISEVYGGNRMLRGPDPIFGEIDTDGDGYYADLPPNHPFYDPDDGDACIPLEVPGCDGAPPEEEEEDCDAPDRDIRNNREELVKFRFMDDEAWHHAMGWPAWLDGKPEIMITNVVAQQPSTPIITTITKMVRDKRRCFRKNGNYPWYVIRDRKPAPMLFYDWDLNQIADPMAYIWQEIDKTTFSAEFTFNSPKVTFKVAGIGIEWQPYEITIAYNPSNERLGEDLVYYCDHADGEGTEYNTGMILFNIKEEEN